MVGRYAKGLVFELDSKRGYFLLKFDPRVKFVKFHPHLLCLSASKVVFSIFTLSSTEFGQVTFERVAIETVTVGL